MDNYEIHWITKNISPLAINCTCLVEENTIHHEYFEKGNLLL